MKKTTFMIFFAMLFAMVSCKKDLVVSKSIKGLRFDFVLPSANAGWISDETTIEALENELKKSGLSLSDVESASANVQTIEIIDPQDSISFDDVDSIELSYRTGNTMPNRISMNTTVGKQSVKIENINKKIMDGDPIRTGDVKLGIGMKLKRPTKVETKARMTVDWDIKMNKKI